MKPELMLALLGLCVVGVGIAVLFISTLLDYINSIDKDEDR